MFVLDPWEHVLGMGLGVVFVNQLVKWDAQLSEDLDKMLAKAKAANERRYFGILSFLSLLGLRFSIHFIWVRVFCKLMLVSSN